MSRYPYALLSFVVLVSTSAYAGGGTRPKGYVMGNDGCWHRTPAAVLRGDPQKPCAGRNPAGKTAEPPPVFTLATPHQVIAALECDFAAAAKATKGKPLDLSRAVISGSLTFSLVTKNSAGASLAVAAIPVLSGASMAPSLEASRLTETTQSDVYEIEVDAKALAACPTPSTNQWITSKVVLGDPSSGGISVKKFKTEVAFVVTRQKSAGLKLNIVPVAIGPQVGSGTVNTQKVSLNFDFTRPAVAGASPAKSPEGAVPSAAKPPEAARVTPAKSPQPTPAASAKPDGAR
jgi:hypothetical protein